MLKEFLNTMLTSQPWNLQIHGAILQSILSLATLMLLNLKYVRSPQRLLATGLNKSTSLYSMPLYF